MVSNFHLKIGSKGPKFLLFFSFQKAIRVQMLAQEKKLKNQTLDERLKDILEEITQLQKAYEVSTVKEALEKYKVDHINHLDDPSDIRNWIDLEEEKEKLMNKLIGESQDE